MTNKDSLPRMDLETIPVPMLTSYPTVMTSVGEFRVR